MNKYTYIPDTYKKELIKERFKNEEEFVNLQFLYRKGFEKILASVIDLNKINSYFEEDNIEIPQMGGEDEKNNFYHKDSLLESEYFYFRNNIHVENLSDDELEILKSSDSLDYDFYKNTFARVLYENGETTYYGAPLNENLVKCKGLVFEFSYDQKQMENIAQLKKANSIFEKIKEQVSGEIKTKLGFDTSFIVYNGIPEQFKKKADLTEKII